MLLVAVIWGLIVGNTAQLQLKYDHCKSIEFKGEYCELQKKLSELKK
jgi:hypothetical protein